MAGIGHQLGSKSVLLSATTKRTLCGSASPQALVTACFRPTADRLRDRSWRFERSTPPLRQRHCRQGCPDRHAIIIDEKSGLSPDADPTATNTRCRDLGAPSYMTTIFLNDMLIAPSTLSPRLAAAGKRETNKRKQQSWSPSGHWLSLHEKWPRPGRGLLVDFIVASSSGRNDAAAEVSRLRLRVDRELRRWARPGITASRSRAGRRRPGAARSARCRRRWRWRRRGRCHRRGRPGWRRS